MLKTSVGTVNFGCCIYNASGPRTGSKEALEKIALSESGAVLSKSATLIAQDGNALPRSISKIFMGNGYREGSLNSEGLPNYGIDYYIDKDIIDIVQKEKKPYIVSLSGLTMDHNMTMLERVFSCNGISAIELNLACPNVPGKPMIAYNYEVLDESLARVCSHPKFGRIPLGIKLAPYFDMPQYEAVAAIIAKYPINYIVCINTIPNGLMVDFDKECEGIAPRNGLGGLGGGFTKHIALANVRTLYNLLRDYNRADIDIVGVGGVYSGKDAFELILCGAKAVQVGSCHWTEGPTCFKRIATELQDIMEKRGYSSIEDFRGKLKPYFRAETPGHVQEVPEKPRSQEDVASDSRDLLIYILSFAVLLLSIVVAWLVRKAYL